MTAPKDAATPRPWRAEGEFIVGADGRAVVRHNNAEKWAANGPLIIRTVNSHDALVKALRDVSAAADALEKANDGKCALCGESAKKGHADDCRLLPFFVAENTLDVLALAGVES